MDTKSITAVIIGLMVSGVILVAFVPIFTEVTATEDTFTNDGYYNLVKIDDTTETVLVWDVTTPTQVTVDEEVVDIPATGRLTLIGSDTTCVRINNANQIQVYGSLNGSQDYKATTTTTTITVSGGIIAVDDGTSKSFDLGSDAYIIAPDDVESDYVAVMKLTTENAYLLENSEIVCCGISVSNQYKDSIGVFGKGTVEDMEFSTFYVGTNYSGDTTITDVVTYSEEVNGYIDLYKLDKFTFVLNYNGGTTSNVTFSYFIVPSEVIAEKSVHGDDAFNAVINIIPLIAGVGLLMAGVYYFISRK